MIPVSWRRLVPASNRQRLLASLVLNFAAKVPGIAAVFIILPLISKAIGQSSYGELLSALAVGSVCSLPFGGINAVGRRLLATAVGALDEGKQADVFVTTTCVMAVTALLGAVILVVVTGRSWSTRTFIVISLFPIASGFFNTFDNLRASYNEHYVTAAFQMVFQTIVYASVIFIGIPKGSVVLSALAIQLPNFLASAATIGVLIAERPFLRKGRITGWRGMLAPALGVTLADGTVGAQLGLSVYWLSFVGETAMAAWAGTFMRLFQSFMSPLLLILFPLTTYVSTRWGSMAPDRRLVLHKYFIVAGVGYGVIVGGLMLLGGPFYVDHMFKLKVRGDRWDVLALCIFLAAIVAQKTYTMLLYAIGEAKFVSYGTAAVSVAAVAIAAISQHWLSGIRVVDVLFLSFGLALPVMLFFGSYRYHRSDPHAPV
jgi:hypothetical protein